MNNEIEFAWCAGFFDGEGHISHLHCGKGSYVLCISIGQQHRQPLEKFKKIVRSGNIGKAGKIGYLQLRIFNSDALKVFGLLKPYLCDIKLKQGEEAIKKYEEYCLSVMEGDGRGLWKMVK